LVLIPPFKVNLDVKFSRDVAFVFRTKLIEPIKSKNLYLPFMGARLTVERFKLPEFTHSISGSEVKLTNNIVLHPKILQDGNSISIISPRRQRNNRSTQCNLGYFVDLGH